MQTPINDRLVSMESAAEQAGRVHDLFNLYHSLGIFSRRQNDVIFLIFPRKQDLTFHANCLLSQKTGFDISCKLSPKETICMKCQILFSGKNKKNISKCRLLKILPRVLSVKGRYMN